MSERSSGLTVYLTGGTGFVGGAVARRLALRGHRVRALVRDPARAGALRELGAELVEGDITRKETLAGTTDGCDAVIHLVGIIREKRPGATFQAVHVDGTAHVLGAARASGVARYVHMSALGARPGGTRYHRSKYEAEERVRASGLPYVTFRPSTIVGPEGEFTQLLIRLVKLLPVVPVIGDGQYRLQPLHVEDAALAFVLAAEREDLDGESFDIGGPHKLTYNRVIEIIGEELGTPRRLIHVPLALVRPLVDFATWTGLPTPINSDELAMLLDESVVPGEGSVLREVFGIEPTPLRAVVQRVTAEEGRGGRRG